MTTKQPARTGGGLGIGKSLGIESLKALTAELLLLRSHPPLVKNEDGHYVGGILGFVKGLRLSAKVVYYLRELLSDTDLEVCWGHIIDKDGLSCSPECDVLVHEKGRTRRWNGDKHSVMEFDFVKASSVVAVVSCKSQLTSIDESYVGLLRPYGVRAVFLLAECCSKSSFEGLRSRAKKAGYKGLWCLYRTSNGDSDNIEEDEDMLLDFRDQIRTWATQKRATK